MAGGGLDGQLLSQWHVMRVETDGKAVGCGGRWILVSGRRLKQLKVRKENYREETEVAVSTPIFRPTLHPAFQKETKTNSEVYK